MAFRNSRFCSGLLVTTPEIKRRVDNFIPRTGAPHNFATTALGAMIPATIFTCMVIPFDLAAVMRQSDTSENVFASAFDAMKKAYSKHGIAAIKAGTALRLLSTYIEMIGFNMLKVYYYEHTFSTNRSSPNLVGKGEIKRLDN